MSNEKRRRGKGRGVARWARGLSVALGLTAVACSGALEPGDEELIPPHEEAKIGAAAHPEIVAQFGGTYDDSYRSCPRLPASLRRTTA